MKKLTLKAGDKSIELIDRSALRTIVSGTQTIDLNATDKCSIKVKSAEVLDIPIGATCTIFGRPYRMNYLPRTEKLEQRLFETYIDLEGPQYDLLRVIYDLTVDTTNNQLQDVQADTLIGDLRRFATVLIANANRVFPGAWRLGECPDTNKDVNLTFGEADNCLLVLQRLCTEFKTEFDITLDGETLVLNFRKVGKVLPFRFEFGKGKGIYKLERQNISQSNIITRLKVQGSSKNLTSKYRSNRLCLPGKNKKESYIEDPEKVAKFGLFETRKFFEDIYPTRTGKITKIYPDNVLQFEDNTMFDLNERDEQGNTKYLLTGSSAKVHFNTGNLAGYQFDASYDHNTHTFKIKQIKDDKENKFPNSDSEAFQFKVGDEYKLLQITMPQSYIDEAEAKLKEEAEKFYAQKSQPEVSYSLALSEMFIRKLYGESTGTMLGVGDYVHVKDEDLKIDKSLRISGFTRDLINEYKYDLTISETAAASSLVFRIFEELGTIDRILTINDLKNPAKSRRNWRDTQELVDLVFDADGYFLSDKIKPLSIETSMLSVGAKSSQLMLSGVVIEPNFRGNPNLVSVTSGTLDHFTISDSIKSWSIIGGTTTINSDDAHYIYARCEQNGNAGTIAFDRQKRKTDHENGYYTFLIGVLHGVRENVRGISLTYGSTTINGAFIKTGQIQSSDGSVIVDLDNGGFFAGNEDGYIRYNQEKRQLEVKGAIVSVGGEDMTIDEALGRAKPGKDGKTPYILTSTLSLTGSWRNDMMSGFGKELKVYLNGRELQVYEYSVVYHLRTSSQGWHVVNDVSYPNIALNLDFILVKAISTVTITEDGVNRKYSVEALARMDNVRDGEKGKDGKSGDWVSYVFKLSASKPSKPTGTSPLPYGWSDAPSGVGTWWMSKSKIGGNNGLATGWSDPIRISGEKGDKGNDGNPGEKGKDGKDGPYTVYQFAKNSSKDVAPSSGWQNDPPTLSKGEYLWMRSGIVTPPATTPSSWSNAVRISGEDGKDGQDGQDGKDGRDGQDGKDGKDGDTTVFAYKYSKIKPEKPTQTEQERTTQTIPNGWRDKPILEENTLVSSGVSNLRYSGNWSLVQSGEKEGYWKCGTVAHSEVSVARITFDAQQGGVLKLNVAASSENNYDFVCISKLNQKLENRDDMSNSSKLHARYSGTQSATVSIDIPASQTDAFVTIMYTKDSGGSNNQDTAWFKVEERVRGVWWLSSATKVIGENNTFRMSDWTDPLGYALDEETMDDIVYSYDTAKRLGKVLKGVPGNYHAKMQGGAFIGTMMVLGNADDGVKSGMSGHKDEPSAFFAGVRNFGQADEYREIDIRHNGTADIGNLRFAKDGAIEFREDRKSKPFMKFGGVGKTLQDVINGHDKTERAVGLQGVNLRYLTPADNDQVRVLPGYLNITSDGSELSITGQIIMTLELNQVDNATGVSVAHLELVKGDKVYSQIDYASIVLSYNTQENLPIESSLNGEGASTSVSDGSNWRGVVQHDVNINLPSVPKGRYTLRLKYNTVGVNIREGGVSVFNPDMVSEWVASKSEIFATEGRFCVVRGKNILYMDGDKGLTVRGDVDMPGVLGGGQVSFDGNMTYSYGKIYRCEKTNDYSNQRFRRKIFHTIGHNRYMVNLTPVGSERMFGRVLEYNASYFVVDFFHAPEEDYQKSWRTPFMFTVIGPNT